MTNGLRAGITLALLWNAAPASNVERLGHECAAGKTDACAQLLSIARGSGDGAVRRMAAGQLLKASTRDCPSTGGVRAPWLQGQHIRIKAEYLFEHELDDARRAEIAAYGDQFTADALRSLGFEIDDSRDASSAVVDLMVFGAARAWLFGKFALDGSQEGPDNSVGILLYPDVTWEGVVTVRVAGRCVCSEVFRQEAPPRHVLYGAPRRKPSEAPFRRDLQTSLAPVMIHLGKDLCGEVAIARMATGAGSVKIRETAVAQLRDQRALAEVVKSDGSDLLRWMAVGKVTNQATLAEAAKHDPSSNVRLAAIQRVADITVLSGIARNDSDAEVRRQAQARMDKLGRSH